MTELMKAYLKWIFHTPLNECCHRSHFDEDGDRLPDERVCARERAWRDYVRIRDLTLRLMN